MAIVDTTKSSDKIGCGWKGTCDIDAETMDLFNREDLLGSRIASETKRVAPVKVPPLPVAKPRHSHKTLCGDKSIGKEGMRVSTKYCICFAYGATNFAIVPAGIKKLYISSNKTTWEDVMTLRKSPACKTIKVVNFGFDGLTYGKYGEIDKFIKLLPALRRIYYCGYYEEFENTLANCVAGRNIEIIPME